MRWLIGLLLCGGVGAQSVTLSDLPGIARARAERQRAEQERALGPYWEDLSLEYTLGMNRQIVDQCIDEVAVLADSVVPLLLEKLSPENEREESRYLADNCARVLARLDPNTFLEDLLELAAGDDRVARGHAITLLGYTGSPKAVASIAGLIPELGTKADLRRAVEALTRAGADHVAGQVVALLSDPSLEVRRAVLDYLNELRPASVAGEVLASFVDDGHQRLPSPYVAYLAAVVENDGRVADELIALPFESWSETDQIALISALGSIAPDGHEASCERLRLILEQGREGEVGRAVAVTLNALGDAQGVDILYSKLSAAVRRGKDEASYAEMGELHYALGMWADAISDFRQATRLTSRAARVRFYQLRIARCDAHRARWKNVLTALRDSGAGYEDIVQEAEQDEALKTALEEDMIRRWMDTLPRREPETGG